MECLRRVYARCSRYSSMGTAVAAESVDASVTAVLVYMYRSATPQQQLLIAHVCCFPPPLPLPASSPPVSRVFMSVDCLCYPFTDV